MTTSSDTHPRSWQGLLAAGAGKDSAFGYGFLPGVLALVIWSMATSIASFRADAAMARSQATTAIARRTSLEGRAS